MTIQRTATTTVADGRLRPDTSAAITTILVNAEATAHRYGWDQQPVLFGLFDHVRADGTAAVEVDPSITEPDLWTTPDPHRPGAQVPPPAVLHRLAT